MNTTDKALAVCVAFVVAATVAFPQVSGYGTHLFQIVVIEAWAIVASLTSGAFADQHHGRLWLLASLLTIFGFSIIAIPVWIGSRKHLPNWGAFFIVCWTLFYVAMLFVLFPATDGP
jgi:hypothetical protein